MDLNKITQVSQMADGTEFRVTEGIEFPSAKLE